MNVLTHAFFVELHEKQAVEDSESVINGATPLKDACQRHGLDFSYERHGNRNSVEHVLQEIKRRTVCFSNCFSHSYTETAEEWLRSLPVFGNIRAPHSAQKYMRRFQAGMPEGRFY